MKVDLGLANVSISLQDIVSAFVGSLLFLAALAYAQRWYRNKTGRTQAASKSG